MGRLPVILVLAAIAGCTATSDLETQPSAASAPPTAEGIARDYTRLTQMTKSPVFVDPGLAIFCRGATQEEVEQMRKVSGPHAHTAVTIYMNDLAADAFQKATDAFPVGSVIVKEKKALGYWAAGSEHKMIQSPDGVGGMIKRAKGYDSEHGDWEYFYFEDPSKIESGKISSCVQCHQSAANKDYVFGGWAH